MEGKDARELDALAISHRIKEIVGKELVLDKETKEYRPAKYGDIVILFAPPPAGQKPLQRCFLPTEFLCMRFKDGIFFRTCGGYDSELSAGLAIILFKDIPLTGVLRSPLVGCTTQELAVLREEHPKGSVVVTAC